MTTLSCEQARWLLSNQLDDGLNVAEAADLAAHLEQCAACRHDAAELFRQDRMLCELHAEPFLQELAEKLRCALGNVTRTSGAEALAEERTTVPADATARPRLRTSHVAWAAGLAASLAAVLFGFVLLRQSPAPAAVVARLENVQGDVYLRSGTGPGRTVASTGATVPEGHGLETVGPGSSAALVFPDGTRLELGGDARIARLQAAGTDGTSAGKRVELTEGQLLADVVPQPAGQPLIIATAHAELRVLGTKLSVSATSTSTLMDVEEGAVQLTSRESQQSLVVKEKESGVAAPGALERASNTLARLPVQGTEQRPVILLEAETHLAASEDPSVRIYGGRVTAQKGVDRVTVTKTQVQVVKKGIARTSVTFQYSLEPRLPSGEYGFQVHYMCGGEPKVSSQSFIVKAGPDAEHLEERGRFKVTNPIPTGWTMQWLKGDKPLTLKAGDALLEIHNEGQAHDAKVFDAFLLVPADSAWK